MQVTINIKIAFRKCLVDFQSTPVTKKICRQHLFKLHRNNSRKALSALFRTHDLTDAQDWLASLWLTGKSESPTRHIHPPPSSSITESTAKPIIYLGLLDGVVCGIIGIRLSLTTSVLMLFGGRLFFFFFEVAATSHRTTSSAWSVKSHSGNKLKPCLFKMENACMPVYDIAHDELINDQPMLYGPGENSPGTKRGVTLNHTLNN